MVSFYLQNQPLQNCYLRIENELTFSSELV